MQLMDVESIIETVREPLLVLDAGLMILFANRSFYKTFKVLPKETIGIFICELGNRQWNIPELLRLLVEILPCKKLFNDFEADHTFPVIRKKVMLLNAGQIYCEDIGTSKSFLLYKTSLSAKAHRNSLKSLSANFRMRLET
jgi:hypothetical protein